jgi:hypothetical protein
MAILQYKKRTAMKKFIPLFIITILFSVALHAQDSLRQYVAKYKFPEGSAVSEITVVLENGSLSFNSAMGNTPIEKTGTDEFSIPAYSGTATFTRNEAKKITGLHIEAGGQILEGTIVEEKTEPAKKDNAMEYEQGLLFPVMPHQQDLLLAK